MLAIVELDRHVVLAVGAAAVHRHEPSRPRPFRRTPVNGIGSHLDAPTSTSLPLHAEQLGRIRARFHRRRRLRSLRNGRQRPERLPVVAGLRGWRSRHRTERNIARIDRQLAGRAEAARSLQDLRRGLAQLGTYRRRAETAQIQPIQRVFPVFRLL